MLVMAYPSASSLRKVQIVVSEDHLYKRAATSSTTWGAFVDLQSTDDTLSVSGVPADAKAAGDAIDAVQTESVMYRTRLYGDSDIDFIVIPGVYYVTAGSGTSWKPQNWPLSGGGTLVVFGYANSTTLIRKVQLIFSGSSVLKRVGASSNSWTSWVDIQNSEGLNYNDKNSIVAAIGRAKNQFDADVMPDYYDTYMANKVTELTTLANDSDFSYCFLTDYHYGTYNNTNNVRPLLTKIAMETPFEFSFNGGDTWTSNTNNAFTFGEAKSRATKGVELTVPNAPCNWFFVLGNHDTGLNYKTVDGQTITYGPYLTTDQLRDLVGSALTGYDIEYDNNGVSFSYYYDVGTTRVIVSNASRINDGGGESATNVYNFFVNALYTAGGKNIVVFTHQYIATNSSVPTTQCGNIGKYIDAFNTRSSYTADGVVGDFSDASGRVMCWSSGHKHADNVIYLNSGVPIIVTTTCNAGAELGGLTRTPGTVTENAFDCIGVDTGNNVIRVNRIGAGVNRTLHSDVVTVITSVELTSELSGSLAWDSSDTGVATVNAGTVYAVNSGTAQITATDADGNFEMWYIFVS